LSYSLSRARNRSSPQETPGAPVRRRASDDPGNGEEKKSAPTGVRPPSGAYPPCFVTLPTTLPWNPPREVVHACSAARSPDRAASPRKTLRRNCLKAILDGGSAA